MKQTGIAVAIIAAALLVSSFLGGLIKAISGAASFASTVPTIVSALLFWILTKGWKSGCVWLQFAIACQVGWLSWVVFSYFVGQNSQLLIDIVFLSGGSAWLALSSSGWPPAIFLVMYHAIGIVANASSYTEAVSISGEAVLIVSIVFHIVPLLSILRYMVSILCVHKTACTQSRDANELIVDGISQSSKVALVSILRNLGGWQRLYFLIVVMGLVGSIAFVIVNSKNTAEFLATCLPKDVYSSFIVKIPASTAQGNSEIHELWLPGDASKDEAVEIINREYPALNGRADEYVSRGVIVRNDDGDLSSRSSCPDSTLRPRAEVRSRYLYLINRQKSDLVWKSVGYLAPKALTWWLISALCLYLSGLMIGWIADGFRRRD